MERLYDKKEQRRQFSTIGLGLFIYFLLGVVLQLCAMYVMRRLVPNYTQNSYLYFASMYLPWYLLAMPYAVILMRMRTYGVPPRRKMSAKELLSYLPICITLSYVGNWLGSWVNSVLTNMLGRTPQNALESTLEGTSPLSVLIFVVILGPIVEELIFRKYLVDALYPFGEKVAILTSALLFAVFHGNFYQFFYAALLGGLFAFIYCRTGKIRYTIILHSIFNFLGSMVSQGVVSLVDNTALAEGDILTLLESNPLGLLVVLLYSGVMLVLFGIGIVQLIRKRKEFKLLDGCIKVDRPFRTALCNIGMLLFLLACIYLFVEGI